MIGATGTRRATGGMISTDHHLATAAGQAMLLAGGSAADAAVAASAVLAVVTPHACGLGGDLLALVHSADGPPDALLAIGRAGTGADPDALRTEGATTMPMHGDVRAVTVPGCVDGWLALHARFGRLDLDQVLAPALRYATAGFPPSPELAFAVREIVGTVGAADFTDASGAPRRAGLVTRPGVARALEAVVAAGRRGFYEGEPGAGLLELGAGLFTGDDLLADAAAWVRPVGLPAWGAHLWGPPPVSQAYVGLAAAWLADGLDLPDDPTADLWPHLLVEALRQAAFDRRAVLHEGADGDALVDPDRLAPRREAISAERAAAMPDHPVSAGDTSYLCVVDGDGTAASVIQSNASSFGSHLVIPGTGIHLQNRGLGFSLEPGHPAEYGPGRRPPHTLSPFLVTDERGRLVAVAGTRGADAQPQVVLQLLARLLRHGQSPAGSLRAPRWLVTSPDDEGFDTWDRPARGVVKLESHAPTGWASGLAARGHTVVPAPEGEARFGWAHLIQADDGILAGAADPRAPSAAAAGH